jgi:mono/diheme cytochrome c family protein
MSKGKVIVWCIVSAVVSAGALTWVLTHNGLSAREPLSPPVNAALQHVRMAAIKADLQPVSNPLSGDSDAWQQGGREFQHDCAMCHGNDGRGHGRIGDRMDPPAPNLASADTQELSDAALYHIIANGIRMSGMPAWADESESGGHDREVWSFVAFIRRLPQLSASDIRALGSEESEHDQN